MIRKNGYIKTMRGAAIIENNMEVPQEAKEELSYDPATPFLGIYTDKTIIQKDTFTPMLIVTILRTAKTWKQSKCSSVNEWIKMWYTFIGILFGHKKEWTNVICSNMDGPRDYHSKWSKSDREWQIPMTSLTCGMENITQMNLSMK